MTFDGLQPGSSPSLTAYVIMRPADPSQSLSGPITSQNVGALQPTPDAVQRVTTVCAARGFDVGPFVGISFAITGPPELFSSAFHQTSGGDLELDDADPTVAALIETVVMDEAAELFGQQPPPAPTASSQPPASDSDQPASFGTMFSPASDQSDATNQGHASDQDRTTDQSDATEDGTAADPNPSADPPT